MSLYTTTQQKGRHIYKHACPMYTYFSGTSSSFLYTPYANVQIESIVVYCKGEKQIIPRQQKISKQETKNIYSGKLTDNSSLCPSPQSVEDHWLLTEEGAGPSPPGPGPLSPSLHATSYCSGPGSLASVPSPTSQTSFSLISKRSFYIILCILVYNICSCDISARKRCTVFERNGT